MIKRQYYVKIYTQNEHHVINNLIVFKQHIQQFKGTNDVLQQVNLKF
jgi:hypothetical protein